MVILQNKETGTRAHTDICTHTHMNAQPQREREREGVNRSETCDTWQYTDQKQGTETVEHRVHRDSPDSVHALGVGSNLHGSQTVDESELATAESRPLLGGMNVSKHASTSKEGLQLIALPARFLCCPIRGHTMGGGTCGGRTNPSLNGSKHRSGDGIGTGK